MFNKGRKTGETIDGGQLYNVSSLLENEPRHKEAWKIWSSVRSGKNVAIIPYSVFVEVVRAVRRRTGSKELAREAGKKLLEIETVFFVGLDGKSA